MNLESYFTPLDKKYCNYFYILSIIFAIIFVLVLVTLIIGILKFHKKLDKFLLFNGICILINMFVGYFVNRLLYSMCVKSIV